MDAYSLQTKDIPDGGAFYLTGDDGFLLKKAEAVFRGLVPEGSLSLYILDTFSDVNQLMACVGVCNFDDTPNVVLIRDDAKLSESEHGKLVAFLSGRIAPDYVLFTKAANLTPSEKKLLTPIDCKKPDKYKCMRFAETLFPYGIDRDALNVLCDYVECDMGKIHNEAFKLLSYCGEKKVTLSDVENLATEDRDIKFFTFSQSLVEKNRKVALQTLEKLRIYGESDAGILSSLTQQFQRILFCSLSTLPDEELAEKMKMKPYAVKKSREIRGYNQTKLRKTLSMLLNIEQQFKTGVMSDATALNLAVGNLLDERSGS